MSTRIKIEPYLSNPIFALVVGMLLVGFGTFAIRIVADVLLCFILWCLMLCSFVYAVYGFIGIIKGKPKQIKGSAQEIRRLSQSPSQEVRSLSQSLKVRYPAYILKVHKLKEKYVVLHEKLPEVRAHSEEFKHHIKVYQAELIELEIQLHDNLRKHAPVIDRDNVEGIAKKILWSDKQIQLTQLGATLKVLAETENPMVPEYYRGILNQIHHDFKRLDRGVKLYQELMAACTNETALFGTVLGLKLEVEEIDALLLNHETELQKLMANTQTQYELSDMALSMFQERFKAFKSKWEF